MNVIVHPSKNGFGHRLRFVTPALGITMDFLDPFEIDDWYDPNKQINVLGDIDRSMDYASV